MGEQGFTRQAAEALDRLEADIERSAADADVDLELSRQDNVIDIEFEDGSKIIINSHEAAGEIWVAARSGGFHFKPAAQGRWVDGRSGRELRPTLAELLSQQAGAVPIARRTRRCKEIRRSGRVRSAISDPWQGRPRSRRVSRCPGRDRSRRSSTRRSPA